MPIGYYSGTYLIRKIKKSVNGVEIDYGDTLSYHLDEGFYSFLSNIDNKYDRFNYPYYIHLIPTISEPGDYRIYIAIVDSEGKIITDTSGQPLGDYADFKVIS